MHASSSDIWPQQCDLPRIDARGLSWSAFKKRGLRGSLAVVLTGLFSSEELAQWRQDVVLKAHGNESFYADDTRGRFSYPKLAEYVKDQHPDRTIFTSDSLFGVFGKAMHTAVRPPRQVLLQDFVQRPIFSLGVAGSGVPKHDEHPETWHALLQGSKAWWLGPRNSSDFEGWEDPCGQLEKQESAVPDGVRFCIQHEGEILYFGDDVIHSNCVLQPFVLGVGAQGHTEEWPKILRAASRGDSSAVKSILRRRRQEIPEMLRSTAGRNERTALHHAALHGYVSVVALLLSHRADVNARDAHGAPASFLAAFSGHAEVTRQLIESGADLNVVDPQGARVLQWAATQGHLPVVDLLAVEHGMDLNARNLHGGGSMSAAATAGHARILSMLLQLSADAEERDATGMRPLHWASGHGHAPVVEVLLKHSAHVGAKSKDGQRPLDLALAYGHHAVAKMLQSRQAKRKKKAKGRPEL